MNNTNNPSTPHAAVRDDTLSRVLVFTSFWGSIFYLLSVVSQALTMRRQPVEVEAKTVMTGGAIFVSSFMAMGSLGLAIATWRRGKTPAAQSREQFAKVTERDGARVLGTALRAGAGSGLMLTLATGCLRLAEAITGKPALAPQEAVDLPRNAALNALLTGLIAAAVTKITDWVALDARRNS
ncbi:MAG: hypothetical protein EI684_06845 [Candidatus Viridilinea halotolerans]|uniref:Uncharacterized protein n=1 Tax=Candidatus Viridilinea halotolerans TaxID=2491704 RepID=A0A426U3R5_9CHLR|nr:MAG: hypothetical protein EI684_06845 [Candidatus Viridilinea halotolerans]